MKKRKYYVVGSYKPAKGGATAVIKRGATEQGRVFKDERAFVKYKKKVCYIPELHDGGYTRQDFLDICGGREDFAAICFEVVDWQSPETWIEEQVQSGEWDECDKCGYFFSLHPAPAVCEKCGVALETEVGV